MKHLLSMRWFKADKSTPKFKLLHSGMEAEQKSNFAISFDYTFLTIFAFCTSSGIILHGNNICHGVIVISSILLM